MQIIKFILLLTPLYCFTVVFSSIVFNIHLPFPQIWESPPAFVRDILEPLLWFFGLPLSFVCCSIYTAYMGLWCWFGAYMILGGIPIGIYSLAVMFA
ncbi:hypothetical protein C0W35_21245 [Photobacterium kishitanii]|nr:hypothetical protein C0W35_21245 [Photobacterium kishitanii]